MITTQSLFEADIAAPDNKFDPQSIRLSQVGSCIRLHSLRAIGKAGIGYTDEDQATFLSGHFLSDLIAARWEKEYPGGVLREVVVHPPEHLAGVDTGHIDLYIVPLNHMVEVKSTRGSSLRFLPHPGYVEQLQSYHHFWGRHHGRVIVEHQGGFLPIQKAGPSTGELCYVLKDKILPPVSFEVEYDVEASGRVEEHLLTVIEAKRTGVAPPIPEGMNPNTFPCNWGKGKCQMYHWCWQ